MSEIDKNENLVRKYEFECRRCYAVMRFDEDDIPIDRGNFVQMVCPRCSKEYMVWGKDAFLHMPNVKCISDAL